MALRVEPQHFCNIARKPHVIWQHHLPPIKSLSIAVANGWACCSCTESAVYGLPNWLRYKRDPQKTSGLLRQARALDVVPEEGDLKCRAGHVVCMECTILSSGADGKGRTPIRTVEGQHWLRYAECPAYWLCDGGAASAPSHLSPLPLKLRLRVGRTTVFGPAVKSACPLPSCAGKLEGNCWLVNPYLQFLGTYDRREVAKDGPWDLHLGVRWAGKRGPGHWHAIWRLPGRLEECVRRLRAGFYPNAKKWVREVGCCYEEV
jgi:hypothetical protein